jgi:hypothetical protein
VQPLHTRVNHTAPYDCVHLILYGEHTHLTQFLVQQCIGGLSKSRDMAEALQEMLRVCGQGLDFDRAVFLLLLNVNMEMKETICRGFASENIKGLAKEKAASFLQQLTDNVIPAWQGNEFKSVHELVEAARSAYLVA